MRFCQVSATASSGRKPPANPMSSTPSARCGWLPNSQTYSGLRLELFHVGLPRPILVRLGKGKLGVDIEQRGGNGGLACELTEKVAHAAGLEVKGCVDPTDEIGGGFEAERRPVECALLPLIHADEVDRSHFPQVVSG